MHPVIVPQLLLFSIFVVFYSGMLLCVIVFLYIPLLCLCVVIDYVLRIPASVLSVTVVLFPCTRLIESLYTYRTYSGFFFVMSK